MNKKFFVILLALSLLFAVALPIFAENLDSGSKDVTVSVDADGNGIPDIEPGGLVNPDFIIYSYSMNWDSLDFMYKGGKWDAENGEYIGGTWQAKDSTGRWVNDSAQDITVTNKSNTSITVKATASATSKYGVDVSVSGAASSSTGTTLPSAASVEVANGTVSPTAVITVSVSGNPTVTDGFSVGTITVTISK